MSTFFISYLLLQTFIALPILQLYHVGPTARSLWYRLLAKTPRAKARALDPEYPHYGFLYTAATVIFTISITFSVISPLILPVAVAFFALAIGVYTYQLGMNTQRRYEGGGRHFPEVFQRLLW